MGAKLLCIVDWEVLVRTVRQTRKKQEKDWERELSEMVWDWRCCGVKALWMFPTLGVVIGKLENSALHLIWLNLLVYWTLNVPLPVNSLCSQMPCVGSFLWQLRKWVLSGSSHPLGHFRITWGTFKIWTLMSYSRRITRESPEVRDGEQYFLDDTQVKLMCSQSNEPLARVPGREVAGMRRAGLGG